MTCCRRAYSRPTKNLRASSLRLIRGKFQLYGKQPVQEDCLSEVQIDNGSQATLVRWSRRCVAGMYAISALWGVLQIAFPNDSRLYMLASLCFALLATLWAQCDSRSCGIRILPILQVLYFFMWPLGALVYSTYRSGVWGLFKASLHGIGMLGLMVVTSFATLYSLHFAGILDEQFYLPG